MSWGFQWRPYVPVAQRKAKAKAFALKLAKKENREPAPIVLTGRTIATTFWGKAWCDNLERYSDFANRLPRGRTYVRNGSIVDLQIERGKIKAIVGGSEVYHVTIDIKTLPAPIWTRLKHDCARSVDSLIDLLQARFDQAIMQRLTEREGGLFPQPKEIKMSCSCPDWAGMCKHVAATLYGVGARLDAAPELLFALRDVDHLELISQAVDADNLNQALKGKNESALGGDLGEIFGIEIESPATATPSKSPKPAKERRPRGNPKPVAARKASAPKKAASPRKTRKPARSC